jgi:hypothetical protein
MWCEGYRRFSNAGAELAAMGRYEWIGLNLR